MMHQQAASSHYNSAQGGSQHYQGQSSIAMMGQSGPGSTMMGQRPMAPYRPSQQGTAHTTPPPREPGVGGSARSFASSQGVGGLELCGAHGA